VIGAGERADMTAVLRCLAVRRVSRLLAEGGTTIHSQLLAQGLADELHLVVAPFFVGGGARPGSSQMPVSLSMRLTE
jgi:5-amino-6-(5-phosphoribosylamino)uracil reductase